jgi:hypothetical protein
MITEGLAGKKIGQAQPSKPGAIVAASSFSASSASEILGGMGMGMNIRDGAPHG